MNETYRKFHSGRFGPSTITPTFETQISGTKGGITPSPEKKSPEPTQQDKKTAGIFTSLNNR